MRLTGAPRFLFTVSLLLFLDPSLLGRAARPALEFGGAAFTFGELEARSNRLAHLLRARGLARGDRLAFFLQNRTEVIDLWLAAVKLGLVLVPVNVLYRERELKHILADSAPAAVVSSGDLAALIPTGIAVWDVETLAAESSTQPAMRMAAGGVADTPLALIYTSGTTGASKGAVLTPGKLFRRNGTNAGMVPPLPRSSSITELWGRLHRRTTWSEFVAHRGEAVTAPV